ncbi:MAG: DedA family protein [Buchnera aphidicola (Nurudea yanoniella)]
MEYWFLYLIQKSIFYSLPIITIVAFLESLALVGLFLPGIVIMAALGTLIGNGELNFYPAWIAGFIGCISGDIVSYYFGWKFKKKLKNFNFLKKNKTIVKKITNTLHKYTAITILIGKFLGPTRPLISMVCGMLNIPIKKFFVFTTFGCILWPPVYFFPGIITGIVINTISRKNNPCFKLFFISFIILIFINLLLIWKIFKHKQHKISKKYLIFSKKFLTFLLIISLILNIINFFVLYHFKN